MKVRGRWDSNINDTNKLTKWWVVMWCVYIYIYISTKKNILGNFFGRENESKKISFWQGKGEENLQKLQFHCLLEVRTSA